MTQHHFNTKAGGRPIEVVVGFDLRRRDFFVQLYPPGAHVPSNQFIGLCTTSRVDDYLRTMGIKAPGQVIDILSSEEKEFDLSGEESMRRRIRFHDFNFSSEAVQ